MADREKIYEALKYHFGFDQFKGEQEEIINTLLGGNDAFVLMPTGGGKSLCYQLPALMSEGTAVVISPLIALMKNQVDALRHYAEEEGIAHFLNSTLTRTQVAKVKEDIRKGVTKLLYVAPESLSKEENVDFLKSVKISFFAIDEAHCISEWGHDFRPEYRKLRPMIAEIGSYPIIALTATATPKVQHDIQKNLGIQDACVYKSSFNRSGLYYDIRFKNKDTDKEIIKYIKSRPGKSGIIYCLSRKRVEELAEILRINEIKALPYHAGMDAATRAANQDAFTNEEVDVVVATIAFGMGIDKPDVRFVIHYDIPKSLEGYYQETGRAGRDGLGGDCITYYSRKDLQKLDKLMQTKTAAEQEIGRQLLMEVAGYAESSVCRRRALLHYFGEKYEVENCGCCDNCINPKKRVVATDELLSALRLIKEAGEAYQPEYICNLLIGRATDDIKSHDHHLLENFGILEEKDERFCSSLLRQAVIGGYLYKDLENYGILKLTPEGKKFLRTGGEFVMTEDPEYTETDFDGRPSGGTAAADETLFTILKDLRKDMGRKLKLPPYVIFQDPSLEAMATMYPISEDELLNIPGVGIGKAKRFGKKFIELISRYVDENDIIRPEEMRVRSVPKKNNLKVSLIQAIDRRIDLEEVAESKGLEFGELLDELEAIVEAGIQLDIDYYIREVIDEDLEEEIIDYLRSQEEDNLEAVIQELGDEADDDKIRLVRVKFISELGN